MTEPAKKRPDQFLLNLPDGWRATIKARAEQNRRTMTQEILAALEGVVGATAEQGRENASPAAANENAALAGGAF